MGFRSWPVLDFPGQEFEPLTKRSVDDRQDEEVADIVDVHEVAVHARNRAATADDVEGGREREETCEEDPEADLRSFDVARLGLGRAFYAATKKLSSSIYERQPKV